MTDHAEVETPQPIDPTSWARTTLYAVLGAVVVAVAALLAAWGAGADLEAALRAAATAAAGALVPTAVATRYVRSKAYSPATMLEMRAGWQDAYSDGVNAARRLIEAQLAPTLAAAHAPPPEGVTVEHHSEEEPPA